MDLNKHSLPYTTHNGRQRPGPLMIYHKIMTYRLDLQVQETSFYQYPGWLTLEPSQQSPVQLRQQSCEVRFINMQSGGGGGGVTSS